MKKRIFWLDFAKGATIFLVVLGHVLAAIFNNLTVSDGLGTTLFKSVMYLIFLSIMPIFFALSGFLYSDVSDFKKYKKMILKKFVSLGVPYTIFSILLVILSVIFKLDISGVSGLIDILYIAIKPIAYLWFLQALFLAFVIIGLFSLLKIKPSVQLAILLVGTFIGELVSDKQFYFYIMQSFSWALCFYLGYLIKSNKRLLSQKIVMASVVAMIISIIWQVTVDHEWYLRGDFFNFENTIAKFASIFIFLYIYQKVPENNRLFRKFSIYGRESLVIYLIHVPVISIFRKVLVMQGITNIVVIFVVCLLGSWYTSICVNWIVTRLKPLDFIFYPLRYIDIDKFYSRHLS